VRKTSIRTEMNYVCTDFDCFPVTSSTEAIINYCVHEMRIVFSINLRNGGYGLSMLFFYYRYFKINENCYTLVRY
jgi:hypothetical protein